MYKQKGISQKTLKKNYEISLLELKALKYGEVFIKLLVKDKKTGLADTFSWTPDCSAAEAYCGDLDTDYIGGKTPHILINKNTIFDEYKEDVHIPKGISGRSETLKKGLYLDSDPNDLPDFIHPIISEACGIDPKLNELVKDLITCIKEEELIPWTDSLIEK